MNQTQPSRQSNVIARKISLFARFVSWLLALAIVILSVVPANLRPETSLPHDLEHFGIFWALGAAFALGYNASRIRLPVLLVTFAGAVEFTQLFIPGRHARLSDFIVDALAACVGAITAWVAQSLCAPLVRRWA